MTKFLIKFLSIAGVALLGGVLFRGTIYDTILNAFINLLTGRSWLFLIIVFFTIFGIGAFIRWLFRWITGSMEEVRYKRGLKKR